jgi:membrane fusion protein (multidrug efflux system)
MMNAEFSVPETVIETAVAEGYNLKSKHTLEQFPEATFLMKNGTEYKHKGKVTSATGVVNASTGTIALKATFPNPEGQLYSGIQGTVVMKFTEKNAIVVPLVAVVKLQDRQQVYKVKADSTATAVEVTTQDAGNGQDCIVVTGLKSGDRIVTVGANNVQEGQKVLFPAVAKEEK